MTEATATPVRPAPRADSRANVVIGVLVVSAFVMILNETILSVALRDLTVDLGVSTTTVQWLTSGFLLTMAVVIPTTGFLLERFTPRQVFLASLTLFSAGTLISALAPGFAVLLVGRVVQACGTAVMIPLLMTSVMRLVPVERRGATMGTITIVIAVAPAIGPTIGGAVLAGLGWRWMFWIVLPLALAALVLGAFLMRLTSETRSVPLDLLSVLLSALGFGGILYGFSAIGESGAGGSDLPPWVPLVVGALALVVFVLRQLSLQRRERALLDLRPFTHRSFVVALILAALLFMSLLGAGAILLPLYLQSVLGEDTFTTGLAVLPGGLALGLLGRPVGRLYDRFGARPLVIPGAIAMALALWSFVALGAGSPLWVVIAVHVLLMVGLGLMMTPLMTEALSALPNNLYSHGSAIMATLQQVAGAFGTAAFVTVATLFAADPTGAPDAAGLRTAFGAAGCVGILAVIVSLFVRGKARGAGSDADEGHGSAGGHRADEVDAPEGAEVPSGAAGASGAAAVEAAAGPAGPTTGPLPDDETGHPADAPAPVGTDGRGPDDGRDAGHDAGHDADRTAGNGHGHGHGRASTGSELRVRGHITVSGDEDAVITVVDPHGRQRGRTRAADGRYEVDLPGTGAWQVVVSAPGHAPRADRIVVDGAAAEVVHDLHLVPSDGRGPADPVTGPLAPPLDGTELGRDTTAWSGAQRG